MEVGGKQSNVARLREGAGAIPPRTPPHNYEAEQALLGALLANNEVYNRVSEFLRPDHFADALHGRIYEAIGKLVLRGQIANPVTLKNLFDQDGALAEIGGAQYLVQLAQAVVTVINAEDYGRAIHDLFLRRQLIGVGEDIVNESYTYDPDISAIDQIERSEMRLFNLAEGGQVDGGPKKFTDVLKSALDMAEVGLQARQPRHRRDHRPARPRPQAGRAAAVRPRHPRRPPVDGQDRARHQHRLQRRQGRRRTRRPAPGTAVAFFSLEMSAEQLAHRIMAEKSGISSDRIRRGDVQAGRFRQDRRGGAGA